MTEQPTPIPNEPKKEYTPRRVTNQQKQQRHRIGLQKRKLREDFELELSKCRTIDQ